MFSYRNLGFKSFIKSYLPPLIVLALFYLMYSYIKEFYEFSTGNSFHNLYQSSVCRKQPIVCPRPYKYCQPVFKKLKMVMSDFSHPNLPTFLLTASNISCLVPDIPKIRWTGLHWQESWASRPRFLLYSAHLDVRKAVLQEGRNCRQHFIRILALYDGDRVPQNCMCQVWFSETESALLVPIHRYDLIDYQGFLQNQLVPYLISCPLPVKREKDPIAVSLVKKSCDSPTNILRVTGKGSKEHNKADDDPMHRTQTRNLSVGVCGPALHYEDDYSLRLIEWMEILILLGTSKVILYRTDNHINVEKVLQYYSNLGILQTISFRYPPPYLDYMPLRRAWTETMRTRLFALENIYFTDCFLRFKDEFDYLAHFDPDEVPILKKHSTLQELLQFLENSQSESPSAYYYLQWRTFYPDFPRHSSATNASSSRFYILNHTERPEDVLNPIDFNGKSIYDTSQVLAVYSHKPLLYADGSGRYASHKEVVVDPSVAYTAHFRIILCGSRCKNVRFVTEDSLMHIKDKVIRNVNFVVKELGLT